MKKIAVGIDAITLKFQNTQYNKATALRTIIGDDVLSVNYEDLERKNEWNPRVDQWFLKRYGLYFKISDTKIEIQFKGTFFTVIGYESYVVIRERLYKAFNSYPRVHELHIAQDFQDLNSDRFLPADHENSLQFCFLMDNIITTKQMKTGAYKTRYLNGPRKEWQIAVYDKTKELLNHAKRDTKEKQDHYREAGYFDSQITRVELRFYTKYCRDFIATIEIEAQSESDLCERILNYFYSKHKVRKCKPGKTFDKTHPERTPEWSKWKKIFQKGSLKLKRNVLIRDAVFKEGFRISEEDYVNKLVDGTLQYGVNVEKVVKLLRKKTVEIAKKVNDRVVRVKATQDHLRELYHPDKKTKS